ncbi:PREDICTED: poly [ADP-ribose] polymerase 14-like, partial [Thamnophis sirtalis]|uniref:Poly [ADP-ribose] polymerase 14-like n=1 Tax=Thamnophis sirtalis TaxID=35019 RepID=A0A6I9Z295_9SAUR
MEVKQDCQTKNVTLTSGPAVEAPHSEKNILDSPQTFSQVVLENIGENIHLDTLTLLVDNISALSGDSTFHIEQINEKKAAVVTFQQSTAAANFLKQCSTNYRFQQCRLTARPLELTNEIKVENIPAATSSEFLTLYFESPKHGGGRVSDIQMLPTEDSALVTFGDSQAALTALKKQHSLNGQSVLVYPFYNSLDTVLYGKEKPQIKMPESISVPLDPYIWQFIQGKFTLIQEVEKEMANCFCELIWPQATCEKPKVLLSPSAILAKQGTSIKELVRSWKDKVSVEFACILSKFKTVKCKIIPEKWETIENNLLKNVLAVPDDSKNCVTLAGFAFTVDSVEKELREYVEHLTKDAEIAGQTLQQTLSISPVKYKVLQQILLEENINEENTGQKWCYDASAKQLQLNGIAAEVYKMKSDLLEKMIGIGEKNVNIHPSIFQFLQSADPDTVSGSLFRANKINAAYELTDDSIALVGYCPEGLLKAEEQINKCLTHEHIILKDPELTNRKQWKELIKHLQKLKNSVEKSVIIDDRVDLHWDAEIVVAGYTKVVADVYQQLSDFVEKNTNMHIVIPAKSVAIVQFIQEEKRKVWCDLNKKGLRINFGLLPKQKNIVLSGPKEVVTKATVVVEQMLSSLYSVNVVFDKPGVKDFFKNQEHYYVKLVKMEFSSLIRLQSDDEKNGGSGENVEHLQTKVNFKNGVVIEVFMGDLTTYQADVVVNASNETLKHIGGLANALLKAAGPQLQDECDVIIQKRGDLKPGCAVITGAGNLPCKQVIHAVGPRWTSANKENSIQLLKKAVRESLKLAEKCRHRSIAIPAISSGIFGFPLKECTHSIVTAIKESLEDFSDNSCLKQIYLMDIRDDIIQAFSETLNEVFGPSLSTTCPLPKTQHSAAKIQPEPEMLVTAEGLKILLLKKGIEEATTDVIVNSIAKDLQLDKGPLSKALLAKAGAELQVELTQEGQGKDIKEGCVLKTSGYALSCLHVLHAILPAWNQIKKSKSKHLGSIIEECLKVTEQLSLSSITFPAIGTGNLGYPKQYVAKVFFDEVFKFSQAENPKSLKEVHFVLHSSDATTIQVFMDELNSRLNVSQTGSSVPHVSSENFQQRSQVFFEPSTTLKNGILKMQIGSVELQLEEGDLTEQKTDAIVNITNQTFNLRNGVSKAIMESAGPEVVKECDDLASQPHSKLICTQGGNLPCKNIIHLVHSDDIKKQVSQTLMECEQRQFTSVAFPAIGTGIAKRDPVRAADSMIDAIVDYASTTSTPGVREIKIIIFQPHLLDVFYASMQRKEATAGKSGGGVCAPKSFFSKVAEFFTTKKPA